MAYSIACEAPWDLGCVMAADTLLSLGSSFRREVVVEIERLQDVRIARRCDGRTNMYCEVLLEMRSEAFALVLSCGSNMLMLICHGGMRNDSEAIKPS